ncbi:GNAT family N-acetyltransferase [Mesorhizobium xinjiangense]|uniref:GNAT family N-acetyltransferase n=1 Tax=Mesorhizobium xinjiangense TaxID=2678685 RepID=UPI0012ED34F5|nr:GNAT family N-acetyltransferase [Mesorhizobium xinjiangense]
MSTISIRPAQTADLDRITAIYGEAVANGTASYELEPPTQEEMASRFAALAKKSYPYLVAADAGKVVGYAYAGPFRERRAYRFMVEDSIYLAPEARGRGLGRQLLIKLIDASTEAGFRQMMAVIGDGATNQASVGLHAALGFRPVGTLEGSGYKHGRWLDTVFMQLDMNGGTTTPPDPESVPERIFRAAL